MIWFKIHSITWASQRPGPRDRGKQGESCKTNIFNHLKLKLDKL